MTRIPISRRRRRLLAAAPLAVVMALGGTAAVTAGGADAVTARPLGPARKASPAAPKRVVIIVVDALRKDFVEKYDMRNIKSLMRGGTNFPHSYLGHMGSETVVTHNVLTSGLLPKHMGWTDEGYRDVDGVLAPRDADPSNDFYLPGDLSKDQLYALQNHAGYKKLQDYLHEKFPGKKVATVSPKTYAAWAFGGATSDITVTFGSKIDCGDGNGANTRAPSGVNVPSYIAEPHCGRYYVDGNKAHYYDTDNLPARMYPLDGNRYTVGHDPAHQGGDVWAADAAMDIMKNEDWSGVFVTLPGVDKSAHMWGSVDDPGAAGFANGDNATHLAAAAKVADQQVGRILASLKQSGQLDDTLVVLTADHGQMSARTFLGKTTDTAAGFPADPRGYYNWYYADTPVNDYLDPSDWVKPLVETGNVGVSFQDSAIRVWLKDNSAAKKGQAAGIVSGMRGVMATFVRHGSRYRLVSTLKPKRLTHSEWRWFNKHGREIVNTSAAKYGADVIGLLRNHTTAGVAGDHGGAQYEAQNIPIVFYGAGTTAVDNGAPIRSVDVMPTIMRSMRMTPSAPLDGKAYRLHAR
ncbi:MAG: alkaline phosphatase family protein [Marmoricola sp.]